MPGACAGIVSALRATEGGNAGPIAATGAVPERAFGGSAGGAITWPAGLVIVTWLVVLLMTTELWMLL